MYQFAANRSSSNFLYPGCVIPERWHSTEGDTYASRFAAFDHKGVFQPLSMGLKNCIGKTLAYAEMKLILSRFLWRFGFLVLDNDFDFEKQGVLIFRQKPPLRMRLVVRDQMGRP